MSNFDEIKNEYGSLESLGKCKKQPLVQHEKTRQSSQNDKYNALVDWKAKKSKKISYNNNKPATKNVQSIVVLLSIIKANKAKPIKGKQQDIAEKQSNNFIYYYIISKSQARCKVC